MRVLITGAAGFIASHLAERLSVEGYDVIGVDNLDPYYSVELKKLTFDNLRRSGVDMRVVSLESDDLAAIAEKVDLIYHLAAQPGNSASTFPASYFRNNILATSRLVDEAQKSKGLKLFINVSTSSVYGFYATADEGALPQPISMYGVTKLCSEQLVLSLHRTKRLPACNVRLFSVYGERERPDKLIPKLLRSITTGEPFPLFAGSTEHRRSFTYVGDIVDGLVSILLHADACMGEILNLGSDICTTTGEVISLLEMVSGQKIRHQNFPKRQGDQLETHADIRKAKRLLGFSPRVSPMEGISKVWRWYSEEIAGKIDYV